jgi:hypothetical protein
MAGRERHVFGCTCADDVTVLALLTRDDVIFPPRALVARPGAERPA